MRGLVKLPPKRPDGGIKVKILSQVEAAKKL